MSQPLPTALYTAQQVRDLDQIAIQERGIPGIKLMKSAGRSVFDEVNHRWPGAPITVFCGAGNNGGDGYIVAALALENRLPVQLIQLASPEKLTGDAYTAYEYAVSAGVPMTPFSDCLDLHIGITAGGVIVDALLGTGLNGQVREPYAQAIRLINHSGLPVVAVDIPSGLSSDTGAALEAAVEADVTVTFIGLKQGFLTGRGPALCGELVYNDLSVPADIFGGVKHTATRLDRQDLMARFPSRQRDAHKGDFGHVLVLGGDEGFGGAVAMAAEAALRTGAGLVSVATRPEHVSAILARRP
ncbi:MAG: NAD(P)H-hydrate epimerase, partial [Porticoccus sp.]|nr:NAD(P)H-hydrate epimerase [Porticoccus sp.]